MSRSFVICRIECRSISILDYDFRLDGVKENRLCRIDPKLFF